MSKHVTTIATATMEPNIKLYPCAVLTASARAIAPIRTIAVHIIFAIGPTASPYRGHTEPV